MSTQVQHRRGEKNMEIQIKDILLKLPDDLYIDQLMQLDIGAIGRISKQLEGNPEELEFETLAPVIKWFHQLFKVLGITHRFKLSEFIAFVKHEQFVPWFQGLFKNF